MKGTIIKNISNEDVEIEVVRYFINNNIEYLIYSLNEIDNAGYTKLYASKIIGNNACIISDDEEWALVKEIIKETVKNNRDGKPLNVIDLDEENLKNVMLNDTRVFKLQGNLVNLLSENKSVVHEEIDEPILETVEKDIISEEDESNELEISKEENNEVEQSDESDLTFEQTITVNNYEEDEDNNDSLETNDDALETGNDLESEETDESDDEEDKVDYEELYKEAMLENKKLIEENRFLRTYQEKIIKIEEILD